MALYSFRIPHNPYSHLRISHSNLCMRHSIHLPTLLAFRIPKHFRESEINNNNNNIPPSEYLHNTHMRGYEIKSEGLLNIHPRLSKKRVLPIYTFYCLQEKPRIPACGVVLYMEVGSYQTKEKKKEKRKRKDLV